MKYGVDGMVTYEIKNGGDSPSYQGIRDFVRGITNNLIKLKTQSSPLPSLHHKINGRETDFRVSLKTRIISNSKIVETSSELISTGSELISTGAELIPTIAE